MLSVFPELLFLAPFSAFVIRISVACLFALAAYAHVRVPSSLVRGVAVLETLAALSLAVGYFAQVGALIGVFVAGVWLIIKIVRPYPLSTIFLVFIMCLSLLVTGPGALAFDLPL